LEVAIDDQLRDAGRRRDLIHRGRRVARVREGLCRGLQNRLAPGGVPSGAGSRGRERACGFHCHDVTLAYTLCAVSNLQWTWSEAELLATDDVAEPLVAGGVRCHGGFADDGRYVSPRAKNRVPATQAWQQSHRELFDADILDAPIELWPEAFPNVAQTKYLLREGVPGPTIGALTRIGTVEGFGSMIRAVNVEKMQKHFVESIDGTAIAHLQSGLFEAHARDEAGWEGEAGHKQMWFAARDLAFENPVTDDMTQTMLVRMGIVPADGKSPTPEEVRRNAEAMRRFPDLDLSLE